MTAGASFAATRTTPASWTCSPGLANGGRADDFDDFTPWDIAGPSACCRSPAGGVASSVTVLARLLFHLANLHRRLLGVYFASLGPRGSYAVSGWLARRLYQLLPPLRATSEAHCCAGLAGRMETSSARRVAEHAFVHRIWDLVDLLLADRLLHRGTFARYGGVIPQPHLRDLLGAQGRGQAAVLVTAYYGPFDLLPVLLGFNGVRATCVYRRHANPAFDALRTRLRARGGCELLPLEQAAARVPAVLAAGGTLALVADHPAEKRGLAVSFLGLPATAAKTVGLLAQQFEADVVTAGIRRVGPFRFEIVVEDVFKHAVWRHEQDALRAITQRYIAALERLILRDPSQYLWAQPRWGSAVTRARPEPGVRSA